MIQSGAHALARDLRIIVFDLPIGTEKLGFKVDVDRTLTIIKVVLRDTAAHWRSRAQVAAEERRRANYIHQLDGIARVGLQGREVSLTTMAKQSLLSLQEEFVAMKAGSVKTATSAVSDGAACSPPRYRSLATCCVAPPIRLPGRCPTPSATFSCSPPAPLSAPGSRSRFVG
ncbi:MAG TPA: hypothetical protein VLJ20_09985 [Acetobacteraceae bacterium]|nr:hypothetical protein [Acetobacteraceae bacterium]